MYNSPNGAASDRAPGKAARGPRARSAFSSETAGVAEVHAGGAIRLGGLLLQEGGRLLGFFFLGAV